MKKIELFGVMFDTLSPEEGADAIIACAKKHQSALTVTPNGSIVATARRNEALFSSLLNAAFAFPDGTSILWAARRLHTPFPHGRVTGVDLGEEVLRRAAREGLSVFFFGGREGVATSAARALCMRYPKLTVAGCRSGYFDDLCAVKKELVKSRADIVFCCLSSPLQETVGRVLADTLSCPVLTLGGSLDIYAGRLRRAPRVMQAMSLEWLWRCLCEPRRFLKLTPLVRFAFDVLCLKKAKTPCNRAKNRYNTK